MINIVVNDQESVVTILEDCHFDFFVLTIMLINVSLQFTINFLSLYLCSDILSTFVQHGEYRIIYVIVYQCYLMFGTSD